MGQPAQDTNNEAAVFRKVDEERKKAAEQLDIVQRQTIIDALVSTKPIPKSQLVGIGLPHEEAVARQKEEELKEFEAERKALLAQEGNRPPVNDPRKDVPVKDELTEEEAKKQAEETEKWANQFLKEEK